MARKSIIQRNLKRIKLVKKYATKRQAIIEARKQAYFNGDFTALMQANRDLGRLPRDSAQVRVRNRCAITGRARGIRNLTGLSRHKTREFLSLAPGAVKQ